MKLLFVLDNIGKKNDVTIGIVNSVCKHLSKENEIIFLGHLTDENETIFLQNDFKLEHFIYKTDEKVRKLYFSLEHKTKFKKIIKLLSHPILSFFGLFKYFKIDLINILYVKNIYNIYNEFKPDAIISVSAPFYTAKAVSKIKTDENCKKIAWMFDPYSMHYIYGGKIAQYQEKTCFNKLDFILIPVQLSQYYNDKKIIPMEFATFEPDVFSYDKNNMCLSNNEFNLLFAGSLYSNIRSPEYLFKLIKIVQQKCSYKINIKILGNMYGEFSDEFYKEFDDFIKSNVNFIKPVPREEVKKYFNDADVLINIGNKEKDLLPSKIFEYFSTYKPILNLKQTDNCPVDEYMNKYSNGITIDTNKDLTDNIANDVLRFLNNSRELTVDKDIINKLFYDNTPKAVADKFTNILKGEK